MPDRELPKETRVNSQRPPRADSTSRLPQATPKQASSSASRGKPVVIIGAPGDIPRALAHASIAGGQFSVAAAIAIDVADESVADDDNFARLEVLLREQTATVVLVAGPVGPSLMRRVTDLASLHRCGVMAVMPTEVLTEHEPAVVGTGDASLIELARANRRAVSGAIKRGIDIACAAIGLVLMLPVLAVVALAIRLESPGSPVFRHERVGYRGRRFLCLKMRTMRVDAEDRLRSDSAMYEEYRKHHFKIPDDRDPRVTRFGRWLRRTSVDEVPQLWNVLVGEMSLVGPRPVVNDELDLYGVDRNVVLSVRPGITGAWAVSGRQSLGYPERCAIELHYVREWRLADDLRILGRTLVVVGRTAFSAGE